MQRERREQLSGGSGGSRVEAARADATEARHLLQIAEAQRAVVAAERAAERATRGPPASRERTPPPPPPPIARRRARARAALGASLRQLAAALTLRLVCRARRRAPPLAEASSSPSDVWRRSRR